MLQASGLAKKYRGREVLRNVDIEVKAGRVVGLLGPNGAGKTTCFYMVVGLVSCDGGRILFQGKDVTHLPMHERARRGIGYLPQEPSVFRKLSVSDNIAAILETRADLNRAERRQQLEIVMDELQIGHLHDHKGFSLSGGERRRVEIARALAANPKLILLDEPFAGVDPISVVEIQRIIAHLKQKGISVLVTDHNVRETLGICDFAYILNEGEVLASGNAAEILANTRVRDVYLGKDFSL